MSALGAMTACGERVLGIACMQWQAHRSRGLSHGLRRQAGSGVKHVVVLPYNSRHLQLGLHCAAL